MHNVRGDLTDVLAKKEALDRIPLKHICFMSFQSSLSDVSTSEFVFKTKSSTFGILVSEKYVLTIKIVKFRGDLTDSLVTTATLVSAVLFSWC